MKAYIQATLCHFPPHVPFPKTAQVNTYIPDSQIHRTQLEMSPAHALTFEEMLADGYGGYDADPGDHEFIPEQSQSEIDEPHITPPKRAIGSDGKGKRDGKGKKRVIDCLRELELDIGRCSVTNACAKAMQIEYAHILPLATKQGIVGFLKWSMAVTFSNALLNAS